MDCTCGALCHRPSPIPGCRSSPAIWLGVPRIVEERYEQPDGSDDVLDTDLLEQDLTATERKAGALNGLVSGENRIRIWEWNN